MSLIQKQCPLTILAFAVLTVLCSAAPCNYEIKSESLECNKKDEKGSYRAACTDWGKSKTRPDRTGNAPENSCKRVWADDCSKLVARFQDGCKVAKSCCDKLVDECVSKTLVKCSGTQEIESSEEASGTH